MPGEAVQHHYPASYAHCYGCGRLNPDGLHLESRWEGDEVVARFQPRPEHTAMPGFVYGGLIASLVDCHAMAAAAAHVEREAGRVVGEAPAPRFVTAALHVDFLRPTPLGVQLELRARATDAGRRKVAVRVAVLAGGVETARGDVVAAPLPESMGG
ncbi:MAG: PaaI family thioesterase [Gemmatimonadetes bacterium]|nr:PaaI family thioesterase [Gemmatimonadota bacterium]